MTTPLGKLHLYRRIANCHTLPQLAEASGNMGIPYQRDPDIAEAKEVMKKLLSREGA